MIHLDDEIINKYLNKELSVIERKSVLTHLRECESCNKQFNMSLNLDKHLTKINVLSAPASINELVMKRIVRPVSENTKGRGFFVGIISVFITIVFVLVGYIFSIIFAELTKFETHEELNITEKIKPLIEQINAVPILKYNDAFTVFLLFVVVTSGYFLYNKMKSLKQ